MRVLWTVILLVGLAAGRAEAHRVNIFAYIENGNILVECAFRKSSPVMHGSVIVTESAGGKEILRGETDEQGHFAFPIPQDVVAAHGDLNIRIVAGEGHQNDWTVTAEEMGAVPTTTESAQPVAPATSASFAAPADSVTLTRTELESIVNGALDAKLAPIKRMLLEQTESGPTLKDIVGGIGWIFGLVGVAAYFKSRPRV